MPDAGDAVADREARQALAAIEGRNPEAKGWGDTFAGRPVKLISDRP